MKKRIMVIGCAEKCANYYNALQAVGTEPFPCPGIDSAELAEEAVGALEKAVQEADGICIPGGCDLNPALYGEANTQSRDINDALDSLEEQVLTFAVQYKKPVLGICRGLQLINVFFGGTLIQNVSDCPVHERAGDQDKVHETDVPHASFLYNLYGKDEIAVNSAHHQAIKTLGKGLKPAQFCKDGLIEAVVHETLPIIALQWHPERMCLACVRPDTEDGLCVFRYFVETYVQVKAASSR